MRVRATPLGDAAHGVVVLDGRAHHLGQVRVRVGVGVRVRVRSRARVRSRVGVRVRVRRSDHLGEVGPRGSELAA